MKTTTLKAFPANKFHSATSSDAWLFLQIKLAITAVDCKNPTKKYNPREHSNILCFSMFEGLNSVLQ